MSAVNIKAFGGMIPAQDDRLLPDTNAAFAQNTWLDSGAVQGLHELKLVHTLSNPLAKRVFRFPLVYPDKRHIAASFWLEFTDPDTDVLRSPVANDQYDRYYFASPSVVPKYNTRARILAASDPYILGVPTPATAPGVTTSGAGGGATEARAYVYTWVTAYGEEGPPSPPTSLTDDIAKSWNIVFTAPTSGPPPG